MTLCVSPAHKKPTCKVNKQHASTVKKVTVQKEIPNTFSQLLIKCVFWFMYAVIFHICTIFHIVNTLVILQSHSAQRPWKLGRIPFLCLCCSCKYYLDFLALNSFLIIVKVADSLFIFDGFGCIALCFDAGLQELGPCLLPLL